jgi:hypothetical protein
MTIVVVTKPKPKSDPIHDQPHHDPGKIVDDSLYNAFNSALSQLVIQQLQGHADSPSSRAVKKCSCELRRHGAGADLICQPNPDLHRTGTARPVGKCCSTTTVLIRSTPRQHYLVGRPTVRRPLKMTLMKRLAFQQVAGDLVM